MIELYNSINFEIAFYIALAIMYLFIVVVTSDTHKEDGTDYVVWIITLLFAPVSLFVFSVIGIIDKYRKDVRE